jgi:hypothetical protein
MAEDLESLKGILLGLGLKELPKLIMGLHKAKAAGNNVSAGRAPEDHGTAPQEGADVQSAVLPLLAQVMQQAGSATAPSPAPPAGPGLSPGLRTPAVPTMTALPRTQMASSGLGGL